MASELVATTAQSPPARTRGDDLEPRHVTKRQREKAAAAGVEIHRPRGLGRGNHTAVVAMVEKNEGDKPGRVRTRVVANVTADNVERVMREYVAESAVIDTDELALYPRATRTFAGTAPCVTAPTST